MGIILGSLRYTINKNRNTKLKKHKIMSKNNKIANSYRYGCVKSGYGSPSIPFYSEGRSAPKSCSKEIYNYEMVYNNGTFSGHFNSESGWFGHRKRDGDIKFTQIKTYDLKKAIYYKYDKKLIFNPKHEVFYFIAVEESDSTKLMIKDFTTGEITEQNADFFNESILVKDLKDIEPELKTDVIASNKYLCRDFKSGVMIDAPGYEETNIHISKIKRKKIEDTPYTRFASFKQIGTDQFQFSGKKWNPYLYESGANVYLFNGTQSLKLSILNQTTSSKKTYFLLHRQGRGNYRFCVENN